MQVNPVVNYFQNNIGKTITESPSPVAVWLGGKLLQAAEGNLVFEFVVRNEWTNPYGTLHGGISALICDEVIGATVYSLYNETISVSVNINIDFLTSAKIGDTLRAEAKVIRNGKSIINAECEITDKRGRIIAKATSNLAVTAIPAVYSANSR